MIQRALWSSAAGMAAAARQVDLTAGNLANVSTPGFKAARADFADLVYAAAQVPVAPPAAAAGGVQVGHGVRLAATPRLWSQGPLQATGSPWDLAIEGAGFLQVADPGTGEVLLTRGGTFAASPVPAGVPGGGEAGEALLVTDGAGRPLLAAGGQPLLLPAGSRGWVVSPDGEVRALLAGGREVPAGRLAVMVPPAPDALESRGEGLYALGGNPVPAGAPGQDGAGWIRQGMLEQSNVDLALEMTRLLASQRAYQLNARAVLTGDEMLSLINRLRS
ncbi:flagellar hook-basal body protein [Thermaerobacter subterraneus]|uniref:Flagellar hook-basal body protein n=1 Tax=Thermaerobacter subterraneus DSM 13965 TaxID=867903 RepID=K6QDB8_9FIRM|nr:flagellar hook-basal body protein [Thermaerobacter subterraneus]EKP94651.1 flagellar hook-basal body protein [Thermaerobacter subterraneus DSM 13965]